MQIFMCDWYGLAMTRRAGVTFEESATALLVGKRTFLLRRRLRLQGTTWANISRSMGARDRGRVHTLVAPAPVGPSLPPSIGPSNRLPTGDNLTVGTHDKDAIIPQFM